MTVKGLKVKTNKDKDNRRGKTSDKRCQKTWT